MGAGVSARWWGWFTVLWAAASVVAIVSDADRELKNFSTIMAALHLATWSVLKAISEREAA